MSQLPVTRRFISGIQEISLMGASCMATVIGWPPDIKGHIFTCLSQPPENTVVPSSFQAEHRTFIENHCHDFRFNNRNWVLKYFGLWFVTGWSCDIDALATLPKVAPFRVISQHRTCKIFQTRCKWIITCNLDNTLKLKNKMCYMKREREREQRKISPPWLIKRPLFWLLKNLTWIKSPLYKTIFHFLIVNL